MHLFTDDEKILSKLSEKGNPLERLDAVMNWNIFFEEMFMPGRFRCQKTKRKSSSRPILSDSKSAWFTKSNNCTRTSIIKNSLYPLKRADNVF